MDSVTNEVYGHVVGSDVFGEAYVIQLHSAFTQMKDHLAAALICLPSQADLSAWLSTHAEAPKGKSPLDSPGSSSQSNVKRLRKVNHKGTNAPALASAKNSSSAFSDIKSSRISGVMRRVLSRPTVLSYVQKLFKRMDPPVPSKDKSTMNENLATFDPWDPFELPNPFELPVRENETDSGYGSGQPSASHSPSHSPQELPIMTMVDHSYNPKQK